MKLRALALVVSLSVTATAAQAVEFDVSGVTLGMDAAAARKAIEAANPKYQMADIKNPKTGKVIGTNGLIQGFSNTANEHFQVIYDESGKVWFVGKSQTVAQGKGFSKEQMLASLIEKYGKPSFHGEGWARWHFDRAGKLHLGEADSPCKVGGGDKALTPISVVGHWVRYPTGFNPKCGRVIEASYSWDQKTGIVSHYGVRAFESAAVYDVLMRDQAAVQKKRDDALKQELGAGNKPGL